MANMLTVYGHYVSQPTRAVVWTAAMKNLQYSFVKVNPTAGEADTEEFYKKFPTGGIPAIEESGASESDVYRLTESHAILSYLAQKHSWNDLYPVDLKHRGKVNQWLHWHHANARNCTTYIFRPVMLKAMGVRSSKPPPEEKFVNRFMNTNMAVMIHEGKLRERSFLTGDLPTLADISLYCELDQLYYGKLYDFQPYPEVIAWMKKMEALPHHNEVRRSLFKFLDILNKAKSPSA